jgi:hypothetical protein
MYFIVDSITLDYFGSCSKILDACVGARADEDTLEMN